MSFIESVKGALPDYAKDTKLNLDAVLLRSTLDADVAMGCAVAALAATGNGKVLSILLADAPVHAELPVEGSALPRGSGNGQDADRRSHGQPVRGHVHRLGLRRHEGRHRQ